MNDVKYQFYTIIIKKEKMDLKTPESCLLDVELL